MIIAGEASGDMHGAEVVQELKSIKKDLEIFGVGGDKMQNAGTELIEHIRSISFIGFFEVLFHLPKFFALKDKIKELLISKRPDLVLLIDYPGFNLKIAKEAYNLKIPVAYYISPQIWAWKQKRVYTIKKFVSKMFVVLHFEEDLFIQNQIPVEFVGHPLLDLFPKDFNKDEFFKKNNLSKLKKIITLLPGSRNQEINKIFPIMVETLQSFLKQHDVQIIVAVAPTINIDHLSEIAKSLKDIKFIENDSHSAIQAADVIIATSGTATLEAAYFSKPMIVLYHLKFLTYWLAKIIVKIKLISLVNIILKREVVKELIQNEVKPKIILAELNKIMDDVNYRQKMIVELNKIKTLLGEPGAAKKVASSILEIIK